MGPKSIREALDVAENCYHDLHDKYEAQRDRADALAARLEAFEAARLWGAAEVESIAGLSETPEDIRLDLLRAAEAIRRGEVL